MSLGLIAKIIQNVRYLNISYPAEALNAFENYGTDLFELPIPEVFYESPETKDLPSQYSRYEISSTFMENYWQTIIMILISLACFLTPYGMIFSFYLSCIFIYYASGPKISIFSLMVALRKPFKIVLF